MSKLSRKQLEDMATPSCIFKGNNMYGRLKHPLEKYEFHSTTRLRQGNMFTEIHFVTADEQVYRLSFEGGYQQSTDNIKLSYKQQIADTFNDISIDGESIKVAIHPNLIVLNTGKYLFQAHIDGIEFRTIQYTQTA